MKITFIEPKAPGLHIFSRYNLPRLGPIILGTILSQAGHHVSVILEETQGLDWELIWTSDLVAISTITATAPKAYSIADKLRAGGMPVVLGGIHPTYLPDEAIKHADWVLRGEADETITPFIQAVEDGRGFDKVPGLTWRQGDEIIHNQAAPFISDLDRLPAPDLSLLQEHTTTVDQKRIIPIQTSRGCPYDCAFCSVTGMFGRKYRFRSTSAVMAELRSQDLSGNHVFFYDDNFTANPRRTKDLLRAMIAAGMTPSWATQVHIDCARDPELLNLMERSNCNILYIGLESINPRTLKEFNKRQSVEQMERALAAIHERGINTHGMFVFGGDNDTPATIRRTAKWAKAQGIATVQFLILTPIPGSRIYQELRDGGRLISQDWSLYDTHHAVFLPKQMSPEELMVETYKAQGSFYSWRQILESLAQGDMSNALVRLYAHWLNRKWRSKYNDLARLPQRSDVATISKP